MNTTSHLLPSDKKELLDLYIAVLDTSPNGIFIYDQEGKLIDCNETACRLHKYSKEELLKMNPKDFIHPDGFQTFLDFQDSLMKFGEFKGISCGIDKFGQKFDVEVYGKLVNLNGKKFLFSTIQDITEQNKNLNKLLEYEKKLEQKVSQRTSQLLATLQDLKKAQKQLFAQEKLAYFGSIIAGISHEIKNPLHLASNCIGVVEENLKNIKSITATLEDEHNKKLIEDEILNSQEIFTVANASILRADNIMKSMLSQMRSEKPKLMKVDPVMLLKETLDLASHSMKVKYNTAIDSEIHAENIGPIMLFPHELSRALTNIYENSYYAVVEKKKYSTDKNYRPIIKIALKMSNKMLSIIFYDNGIGIPSDIKKSILKPFYSSKPPGAGTGLGLSIVSDIIKQLHEGRLSIKSKEGEFTTVKILIPKDLHRRKIE